MVVQLEDMVDRRSPVGIALSRYKNSALVMHESIRFRA